MPALVLLLDTTYMLVMAPPMVLPVKNKVSESYKSGSWMFKLNVQFLENN